MISFYTRGRLGADNRFELGLGYCDPRPRRQVRVESPFCLRFRAADGTMLLEWPLALWTDCAPSCREARHGSWKFRSWVPLPEGARSIDYVHRGIALHRTEIAAAPPVVEILNRFGGREGGRTRLEWRADHPERLPLTFFARYSNDGGRSWQRFSFSTREYHLDLDLDEMPGGRRCMLAVVATDGVLTTVATTSAFAVALKPLIATIVTPLDGDRIVPGFATLAGQGFELETRRIVEDDLAWSSSVDGELGRGRLLEQVALSPGEHTITLRAGRGERAGSSSVTVTCVRRDAA